MSDYKIVHISFHDVEKKETVSRDGKVTFLIEDYPLSEAAKDYLDQGWKISGFSGAGNYVNLLLTR